MLAPGHALDFALAVFERVHEEVTPLLRLNQLAAVRQDRHFAADATHLSVLYSSPAMSAGSSLYKRLMSVFLICKGSQSSACRTIRKCTLRPFQSTDSGQADSSTDGSDSPCAASMCAVWR